MALIIRDSLLEVVGIMDLLVLNGLAIKHGFDQGMPYDGLRTAHAAVSKEAYFLEDPFRSSLDLECQNLLADCAHDLAKGNLGAS